MGPADWLLAQGVAEHMGPDSLAMSLIEPGREGWANGRPQPLRPVCTNAREWRYVPTCWTANGNRAWVGPAPGLSARREHGLFAVLSQVTQSQTPIAGRLVSQHHPRQ